MERAISPLKQDPWDGMDAAVFEELARAHGTPFFLYDADEINARIRAVQQAFPGMVKVFYAVKANPNLALLRAVSDVADGLDISSGGELEQACLAGFDTARLSFAGPAKTTAELTESIRRSIGYISIESLRELLECIRIARQVGTRANVAIRVNPVLLNRAFGLKMGGKAVQFGIDEEDLSEIVQTIVSHPAELAFQGIHIYAGSQCFDAAGVVEGVADTLRIVREIESNTPLTCRAINLGGGFGVSHVDRNRELDLVALASELRPVLHAFIESSPVQRKIVFELGRYLTANAGIYVSRVISSKSSRGKEFFVVDGGLHHHLAAAGTFGTALRSNFILRNLTRPGAETVRCQVAGPSCNPTDLLGIDVELPRPEHGDLIGVLKSGSYGMSASPLLFLGRQTPAELVRHNNSVILGRRPHLMTDFN
ncbi:MAG TPA: pyridoxal-dependent decarboxylase, exosortase A system-associated [Burkholderiales bacterium]|nr:pyridoxal-dependent decarboxylase, exosortase A system-associated [Burkholderiales bacterium]